MTEVQAAWKAYFMFARTLSYLLQESS